MKAVRHIPVGDFRLGSQERKAIANVLDHGRLSEWRQTAAFENEFAAYIGVRHAVAVNSGTSALMVILRALMHRMERPLPPGAKVVTSPLTFIATPAAVRMAGFDPVFVDVDPTRFSILPQAIEDILRKGPAEQFGALLPVHLMGYPADMDAIGRIADRHGLALIEDSAQAHGSSYGGRRTGSIGLAGAFSFYIAHNIQAGEMGAVTTNDAELASLVHSLKAHGRRCRCRVCMRSQGLCPFRDREDEGDPRFTHDFIGYNFKVMEFQATLGLLQLRKADAIFQARQKNVATLNSLLADLGDFLVLPELDPNVSYLAYPVVLRENERISREHLRHRLEGLGVENRPLFSCLPTQQPAFASIADQYRGKLPNAERLGRQALYIGCHQFLSQADLEYVSAAFHKIFDEVARPKKSSPAPTRRPKTEKRT